MVNKNDALKMAIEAIENLCEAFMLGADWSGVGVYDGAVDALQACNEALEQPSVAELNDEYLRDTHVEGLQPAQEPVAWVKDNLICPENNYETTLTEEHPKDLGWTPLYISQQARLLQEPIAVCKDSIVNWVNGKAIDGWLYTHPAPQPAQEPDSRNFRHTEIPVAYTNAEELNELKSGMTTCYMYAQKIDDDDIALYTHR